MKTFLVVLVAFYAEVYGGKIINTSQSFFTHFFHYMFIPGNE